MSLQHRRIDEQLMLKIGLHEAGFRLVQIKSVAPEFNKDRFISAYGISPKVCCNILDDLMLHNLVKVRHYGRSEVLVPDVRKMLMTLHWFKEYPREKTMSATYGISEDTVRKWVWIYSRAIQRLAALKICWYDDLEDDQRQDPMFLLSVDGTHFQILEPRTQPSKQWYSHKFNKPALCYEIGLDLKDDRIVWTNGPFPAATHDKTIFQKPGGLASIVPEQCLVIADKAYRGKNAPPCLSTTERNPCDTPILKEFKKRARGRHEKLNAFIKKFSILSDRYRHTLSQHQIVFEAACVIVQYSLETDMKLFDI